MAMTLRELADRIGARLEGDGDVRIDGCAPITTAGPNELTFVANAGYRRYLDQARAGAVLVDDRTRCPEGLNRLIADDPKFALRNAVVALHGHRVHPQPGDAERDPETGSLISRRACIDPAATLGAGVVVHPFVTVCAGATVGPRTILYPGAYVGSEVAIGEECVLHPNAVIYERCAIGDRCTIHANSVIGHDGFGYATHGGKHHKIPQAAAVLIGDDVEFGAGCAVERGALNPTTIGNGTKLADLISVGHGTRIGDHCMLVSLVGISGSVELGDYVLLGGQVGIVGHLKIGDRVQVAGQSAVINDIAPGSIVGGRPARDAFTWKRNVVAGERLYELLKRVESLERQLASKEAAGQTSAEGVR